MWTILKRTLTLEVLCLHFKGEMNRRKPARRSLMMQHDSVIAHYVHVKVTYCTFKHYFATAPGKFYTQMNIYDVFSPRNALSPLTH